LARTGVDDNWQAENSFSIAERPYGTSVGIDPENLDFAAADGGV
jgi:hypothetical protein